jgi:PAS domain S-box-containing protein
MEKPSASHPNPAALAPLVRYGLAAALVAAMLIIRWLIDPFMGNTGIFIFFAAPVAIASYYGGLGPGLVATALGAISGVYFFVRPTLGWHVATGGDLIRSGMFIAVGVLISCVTETMHRSRHAQAEALHALAESERRARELAEEHEQALAELRARSESLRFTLTAGRMGSWQWNIKTGAVTWSENLEELHGLPRGAFGGTLEAFLELVDPEDRGVVQEALERAMTDGEYDVEFRVRWPDGSVHWMRGTGHVSRDLAGQPERMTGLAIDITSLKEAELDFARLAAIVESSNDAIVGKNLDGVITSWNKAAERLYGYTEEEALGRSVSLLTPSDRDDDLKRLLDALHKGERLESFETVRITKDGARIDVSLTISPILDRQGNLVGASAVARDITERKRLDAELHAKNEQLQMQSEEMAAQYEEMQLQNEELAEQDRQRNEFLAMLGHELRNPLAPLAAAAEVLRVRSTEDESLLRQCHVIERQTRHLARIVDDLLDVSRITQGKVHLQTETIDLATVVEQSIQICSALINERGHEFTTSLPAEPVPLQADPTRLVQVICNLLNNAAKYTEPGGKVELAVEHVDRQAVVRIRDSGRGIAKDMLPRVFDLFVQGERNLARTDGGLGVGLTLVRRLVELHGGTVEAQSAGLRKGSEFIVRIPALTEAPPAPAARRVAAPTRLDPSGTHVLLIDDNADLNEALGELIHLWGYPVSIAHDAQAGLRLARELRPRVILLDIGLPDMSGHEVVGHLRDDQTTANALIFAVSGYGQPADRKRSLDAGFDDHFVKPVDPAQLRELLERAASVT